MKHKNNMLFLLIFTSSVITSLAKNNQWIDPHDMNTNYKKNIRSSSDSVFEETEKWKSEPKEDFSLLYLKRIVNLIINSKFQENILPSDLDFLKSFTKTDDTVGVDKLRQVDTIMNSVFYIGYKEKINENLSHSIQMLLDSFSANSFLLVLGGIMTIYIVFNMLRNKNNVSYIAGYLIFVCWVLDYFVRYHRIQSEVQDHNENVQYADCKLTWTNYFLIDQNKCNRRHVHPLDSFLEQINKLITMLGSAFGAGLGLFGTELFQKLPFPWNIILFPILLLFTVLITLVITVMVKDLPLELNIFHMVKFKFGKHNDQLNIHHQLNAIAEKINHRPLVVDVRHKKSQSQKKTKNEKKSIENKPKNDNNDKKQLSKVEKDKTDVKSSSFIKEIEEILQSSNESENKCLEVEELDLNKLKKDKVVIESSLNEEIIIPNSLKSED